MLFMSMWIFFSVFMRLLIDDIYYTPKTKKKSRQNPKGMEVLGVVYEHLYSGAKR